jgi:predicted dienelactone hydrolase
MSTPLVTTPLEPLRHHIGRITTSLVDTDRQNRVVDVACWYPAVAGSEPLAEYELLAGVTFFGSAHDAAQPLAGSHPVVVFSHGRTGTNLNYSQLLEALASRGFVVVAVNHLGDTTMDWLTGTAVDDATNERQRVGDLSFVINHLISGTFTPGPDLDLENLSVVGHSYGGYTALAFAAFHGNEVAVRAVVGLHPFLTPLTPDALSSIDSPVLLIGGAEDTTTPVDANVHAPSEHLSSVTTLIFDEVGHQGCSDIGLYGEMAPTITALPEEIVAIVRDMATSVTGRAGDPWRPAVERHLAELSSFLELHTPPVA